ncbi:hypothetical protein Tco_0518064 [Tanacetum coccineum]
MVGLCDVAWCRRSDDVFIWVCEGSKVRRQVSIGDRTRMGSEFYNGAQELDWGRWLQRGYIGSQCALRLYTVVGGAVECEHVIERHEIENWRASGVEFGGEGCRVGIRGRMWFIFGS